jgi:hypothetical protein
MAIPQNQNTFERFARIIIGGICVLSASYITMPNILILILMLAGLYLMFSGLAGQCVIYKIFGINTSK